MLLNLSATAHDNTAPTKSRATYFIDLKGDINSRQAGDLYLDIKIAGEHPIDHPKTIISD